MHEAALDRVYDELERPLIPVLVDIEQAGVRVDAAVLGQQAAEVDAELDTRAARIYEMAGETFNINSPKQLGDVLFTKLKMPALKRTGKTRTASTAQEVLEELALVARSAARGARVARAAEAERHLHRRAAAAGEPADRPGAHLVQPGDRGHRPLEQQRAQPSERADPHRGGPRDPPRLRRRAAAGC